MDITLFVLDSKKSSLKESKRKTKSMFGVDKSLRWN